MDMDKNDMEYKSERSHLFGLFSIFPRLPKCVQTVEELIETF